MRGILGEVAGADGGDTLEGEEGEPDEEREEERLGHRGGREVEEVGVEGEEGGRGEGPAGDEDAPGEAVHAGDGEDEEDHRRPGAGEAVLPPGDVADEGQHGEVREGKPDAAELDEGGVAVVDDAAGDAEMGDGVSVEEEVAVGVADDEGDEGEDDRGQGGGHGLFAGGGADEVGEGVGLVAAGGARGAGEELAGGFRQCGFGAGHSGLILRAVVETHLSRDDAAAKVGHHVVPFFFSREVGDFAEGVEAGVDLFAGEGLEALGSELFTREAAHDAAVEGGGAEDLWERRRAGRRGNRRSLRRRNHRHRWGRLPRRAAGRGRGRVGG